MLIPKKMREIAHVEKCVPSVKGELVRIFVYVHFSNDQFNEVEQLSYLNFILIKTPIANLTCIFLQLLKPVVKRRDCQWFTSVGPKTQLYGDAFKNGEGIIFPTVASYTLQM